MKVKKADEMEKFEIKQAARNGFLFYTVALLIWSSYDFIKTGERGWEATILLVGLCVYFWTLVYYKRKVHS
ncbi:hypothetical protein [Priestia aryabhattai]|uniref:hypothetical protein n=1 Tax=Priestia aryabhattai TaxID=412384 RepID=UPI00211BAF51|nr:hypothetical protein [Priestia aryabhattai]MCQ9284384.1 hypothetical protein [Priestia aryabhattai]